MPEKFEVKFTKAKELREAYERQSAEYKAAQSRLAELEAKVKEAGDHKTSELLERLKTLETERETMAKELSFVNYERSPEYKAKFVAPITEAFRNAYQDIEEMTVSDPASGTERPATADDFNALVRMPIKEATIKASEQFGPLAQQVLTHRAEIIRMDRARVAALEDYKKNSGKYEQERASRYAAQTEQQRAAWESANKEIAEKYPTYFKPDDKDPKGNELLQKGFHLFDAAVSGNGGLSPEQRTRLMAAMRHKAAGFDRVATRLNAANKRIAELENALAEYEKSEPGGEVKTPAGTAGDKKPQTWQEELDSLAER